MQTLTLAHQQKLQQKITPQQIQLLQFVQLNILEVEKKVKNELEDNPFLEEENNFVLSYDEESAPEQEEDYSAEFDTANNEFESQIEAQEPILTKLRTQLNFLNLTYQQFIIADEILGNVDDNGYLTTPLINILENLNQVSATKNVVLSDVEWVLHLIQRLDPPAIASRSLQECLLIQLHFKSNNSHLYQLAEKVLKEHFDLFSKKHFEEISKRIKISISIMKQIIEVINSLNPKPGESFSNSSQVVVPDVIIRQVNDKLLVHVNEGKITKLKLKKEYYDVFYSKKSEIKEFLDKKFNSAKFLMKAIDLRRTTLFRITNEIVNQQKDFFVSQGPLIPLTHKIIAEKLNLDESTISRAINGKFAQTDFGVFPFSYFFSEAIHTTSGVDVSTSEIINQLAILIKKENHSNPLSDIELQKVLKKSGFEISRRTVTKYREKLHLPVARLRRKL